ncbi:MAG: L,D-transpeptidase [Geobacteraceae bacterium]|nr:L,D-transpeptidase [Geobacteraceae bacterium]
MKSSILRAIALFALLCSASGSIAASGKIKSLCDLRYPSDARIEWECRRLKWTDTAEGLFGDKWQDVLRFNRMDRRHFYGGRSIKVPKRLEEVSNFTPLPATYPDAAQEEKFILVDQSEMFLGAYEYGRLVLSLPVALGVEGHRVPNGEFRIDAVDRRHRSNLYTMEEIGRRYPMHYGLRFYVDKSVDGWPSYWIHGRDLPGHPASHGCIGLYDEEMQIEYYSRYDRKVNKPYYHELKPPLLEDAKKLYMWVIGPHGDPGAFQKISYGPRVLIIGTPPA